MTETRTEGRWCSQHRQPREQCRPDDRHVQPLRCSDELMAQVEARGKVLGLDRNAAAEQALREFAESPGKATAVRSQGGGREKRPAARTEPPVPVAAGPDLAETVAQLQRQMDELMAKDEPLARARSRAAVTVAPEPAGGDDLVPALLSRGGPVESEEQAEQLGLGRAWQRGQERAAAAPGTAVFLEPGAEPVASFPVPEVPARGKRGSR